MSTQSSQSFQDDLVLVFGPESRGDTPSERARTSSRRFVRSQDHLAVFRKSATGRVLSAWEAYSVFGFDMLKQVTQEGIVPLVCDEREPASTLRERRQELGLDKKDLAKFLDIAEVEIDNAEDSSKRNPISVLERIARVLGLDDGRLSLEKGCRGDQLLAVRLRALRTERPYIGPRAALAFSEAAWIIDTQYRLAAWLSTSGKSSIKDRFEPSENYGSTGYPAWQHGYFLAHKTRELLGIDEDAPIVSLRQVCEETLQIPIIQIKLPPQIAGATIAVGDRRGIVVNLEGDNKNEWVRRVTIAHELGHLLWDPDGFLKELRVDDYSEINDVMREGSTSESADPYIEQRANAFAIEFLAPQSEVERVFARETPGNLRKVMEHFGLSFTSARFQVWNSLSGRIPLESIKVSDTSPTDEWKAAETFAIDYFEPDSVPFSRRGRFAGYVVEAEKRALITANTAAEYLACSSAEYEQSSKFITDIYPGLKG